MFRIACDFDRLGSRFRTAAVGPLLVVLFSLAVGCSSDPAAGIVVADPNVCLVCTPFAICDPELANPCICPEGFEGDGTVAGSGCLDIDECASGAHNCVDGVGICTNTSGGFTCGCEDGYEGDGTTDGTGCTGVDECGEGTDNCVEEHGVCTTTEDGFTCGCEDGYEGDGTTDGSGCTDVDECSDGTDDCVEAHGLCTNTDGGFTCGCEDGYEGDGTAEGTGCTDIDECELGSDNCVEDSGICTNTDGSYTCACEDGYEGDGSQDGTGCVDIDECAQGTSDCVADLALCNNTPGGYECECLTGYEGDGLTDGTGCTDINECELGTDDCVDGPAGLCANTVGGYTCECEAGYEGDGVEGGTGCTDIDECALGTAECDLVLGSCANTVGGYLCVCNPGYEGDGTLTGTGCADINECETGDNDCVDAPAGTCVNTVGAYTCGCAAGYQGDGVVGGTGCTDLNECELGTAECAPGLTTCVNTIGTFLCVCAPGYEGDGLISGTGCTDINECQTGDNDCVDAPMGTCMNTVGAYTCGCAAGYEGDGIVGGSGCVDIDECALGTDDCMDAPGFCTNQSGGYTCGCQPGYEGDGTLTGTGCVDVDECALGTDECVDAPGICTNTVGAYTCSCEDGYEGDGLAVESGGTGCVLQNPRLTVPKRMVNDKTLTLRAEILIDEGQIDLSGCYDDMGTVTMTRLSDGADIPLTVTFFDDHLPIPEDSIRFYHGVGSVSFTLDDGAAVPAGDYQVTVMVNGLTAVKDVEIMDDPAWRVMPATLTGADLIWGPNENIRISEHFTEVPAGSTLTILPGTLIMVDTTGGLENGTLFNVYGTIDAVGTLGNPIAFFSEMGPLAMTHTVADSLSNVYAWRGVNFWGTEDSVIKWVMLTGAGNGVVTSHPRPPIWNMRSAGGVVFEDCVFVDSTGMMFQTPGTGSYAIRRTLVSRVGIGGEFLSSGHTILIEDSFWTGIGRGPNTPMRFDGDGIHIDGLYSDQTIRRCIIADVGDDCIDHSNSTFLIEDTVIHDCKDKGNSMTAGLGMFNNVLMFNTGTGIRGTAQVFDSTITVPSPINVPQVVQSSIIWPSSLWTCSGEIDYTLVGNPNDLSCGDGNLSADPVFTNPDLCDYTLAAGSPALTAGPGGEPIGWLGYPVIAP